MNISNFNLPNHELKIVLYNFNDDYANNPIVIRPFLVLLLMNAQDSLHQC